MSNVLKDKTLLIILDDHNNHVSTDSVDIAKNNSIMLLRFPPYCTHKLQPFYRSVFGPLKKYYNNACTAYMISYPKSLMTIYEITELANHA